jgi:glycosyltransferase 2 family protein
MRMKAVPLIAALAGLAVILTLIAVFGAGAVVRSFLAVGWAGFTVICLIHLALVAIMAVAWRGLVAAAPLPAFLGARLLREASSEVLPLSPIGGCVLGVRALMLAGVTGPIATASTIVDLTLEFFGKLAYTGLGLVLLVSLRPGSPIAAPLALGLFLASLAAAGIVAARHRGFRLFDRLARALGRGWAERSAAGAAALRAALQQSYRRRAGLWTGFVLHLVCWIAGAVEAWVALRLLDSALPFKTVLVIESMVSAVRTFGVVIPNAIGLQEGAYVLLGAGFGLTPNVALVLSLVKRARDLAIGLPTLGAWQLVEGGRLWRRRLSADSATGAGQSWTGGHHD